LCLFASSHLAGQFAIHIYALVNLTALAEALQPLPEFDPENEDQKEFKVNLVNSAVYLLLWGMQVTTIFVNYNGVPVGCHRSVSSPAYSELGRLPVALFPAILGAIFPAILGAIFPAILPATTFLARPHVSRGFGPPAFRFRSSWRRYPTTFR